MAKARTQTVKLEERKPVGPSGPACVDLDRVIGQDRAVSQLRSAIESGRLHHAWIFAGPPGVGKRTTAEAFATLLLDPDAAPDLTGRLTVDPEGHTARLMRARTHPDYHLITKELAAYSEDDSTRRSKQRNIPLAVLQEYLIEPAQLAGSGRSGAIASKVFVVDEAELMRSGSNEGQNAMLKTLEEPPPGTIIILVTAREEALLPTIRSRCQRVRFDALSDADMQAWLDRTEGEDRLEVRPGSRPWLLEFAAGSPGRARIAIETGLLDWESELRPFLSAIERGRYDPDFSATLSKLVGSWAEDWVKARPQASKEAANHAAAGHAFHLLAQRMRRLLADASETGDAEAIERWSDAIEAIAQAEREINANVQMALALEHMSARFASAVD
ncbi:MAG: AAA family ATPase [bacterium]|nr:AAA family ATPase [bacterium]